MAVHSVNIVSRLDNELLCNFQARLRLDDTVTKDDVDEAMRLMEASKSSLRAGDGTRRAHPVDPVDAIFRIARDMHDAVAPDSDDRSIALEALERRAGGKGACNYWRQIS